MASTSGRVEGPRYNSSAFYFQWQRASVNVGGNYTTINWQWGLNTQSGAYWGSNAVRSVSGYINGGQAFGGATWSNISGNGDHQLLNGSFNIGHNNDGSKAFGISSTGWLYGYGNVSGGSGSWDLPTIPRGMTVTAASNFTDESNPSLSYSNPAGANMDVYIEMPGIGAFAGRNIGSAGSGTYTWDLTEAERNLIRGSMWQVNSVGARLVVHCVIGGQNFYDWADRTATIVNANPIFTDFAYKDTNPVSLGITSNDQAIVQGKSTLSAVVLAANKMVVQKGAAPVQYTFNFDTLNAQTDYSTSDITKAIGTPINSGIKTLTARAFDTRNNSAQVTKDINVIPYTEPVITATVERANGFEDETALNISGSYSLVSVNGTPKNTITLLRYRYRETGGTWGPWVNRTFILTDGNITTSELLLSLDNNKDFEFEVEVTDKFGLVTIPVTLGKGKPLWWIGGNRTVAVNHKPDGTIEGLYVLPTDQIWDQIYPVGRSYVTTSSSEDANDLYRGVWTRSGSGPYTWTRNS